MHSDESDDCLNFLESFRFDKCNTVDFLIDKILKIKTKRVSGRFLNEFLSLKTSRWSFCVSFSFIGFISKEK